MCKKVSIPYQSPAPSSCGCEKCQAELCSSDLVILTTLLVGTQRGPSSRSSSGVVITRVTVSLDFCSCFLARPFCLQTARWATDPESKSVKVQRQYGWYTELNHVHKECSIQLRRVWGFFKDSPMFSHSAFDKIEWVCIIFKIMAGIVVAKKSAYWSQTKLCKARRIWDSHLGEEVDLHS